MGALTEVEIFDCMTDSLDVAIEQCGILARRSIRGMAYVALRNALRKIEGCCKQASAWREDTRWLNISLVIAECHKRAGDWLRGVKMPDGTHIKYADSSMNVLFVKLADNLRALKCLARDTKNLATKRTGMILPEPIMPYMRENRRYRVVLPPGMAMSNGGVILPGSTS